jgi:hypothetical protein
MRELVFEIEYEQGINGVADTLAEYPDAQIRSLSLHATTESLWRVDHVTGPTDALTDIKEAFLDTDYYTDCLRPGHCGCDAAATGIRILRRDARPLLVLGLV